MAIGIGDVENAYLLVDQPKEVFVEPPPAWAAKNGNMVWQLLKVLPGQREGSSAWSDHFTAVCKQFGLEPVAVAPCILHNPTSRLTVLLHIDDFQVAGKLSFVADFLKKIAMVLPVKVSGPFYEIGSMFSFLKRSFAIHRDGITVVPNEKYIDKMLQMTADAGYKVKARKSPSSGRLQGLDSSDALSSDMATVFRSIVGVLLYVVSDRPDLQQACNALCTKVAAPTRLCFDELVWLIGYISETRSWGVMLRRRGRGRSVLNFSGGSEGSPSFDNKRHVLEVITDADWAGDKQSRRSTSSCHIYLNGSLVHSFVRSQKCVALSSAESEFLAACSGCAEGLFILHVLQAITGETIRFQLRSDSSAARGVILRQGAGKLRHVEGKLLWLQDLQKQGKIEILPVPTTFNASDMGTKALTVSRLRALCCVAGVFDATTGLVVGGPELEQLEADRAGRIFLCSAF